MPDEESPAALQDTVFRGRFPPSRRVATLSVVVEEATSSLADSFLRMTLGLQEILRPVQTQASE